MKKPSVRVKFSFEDAKDPDYYVNARQFVSASSLIPDLSIGTPPLPSKGLTMLDAIDNKRSTIANLRAQLQTEEEELDVMGENFTGVLHKMQANAINYIEDDAVKAAGLGATVEPYNKRKGSITPEQVRIKAIKDGTDSGTVKIVLEEKPEGSRSYQVRYTRNYGQPDALTVFCEDVFTNMQFIELSHLPVGEKVVFEVRANGVRSNGPWSSICPKIIS